MRKEEHAIPRRVSCGPEGLEVGNRVCYSPGTERTMGQGKGTMSGGASRQRPSDAGSNSS